MTFKNFNFQKIIGDNLEGFSTFVWAMSTHEGILNSHRLHKVKKEKEKFKVVLGSHGEKINDFSIGIGGEVVNSYCCLYEAAYFIQALMMSGVGSYVIRKNLLEKYKKEKSKKKMLRVIGSDLKKISEEDMLSNMQNPLIAIISSLDTDIAPVRYNKHQLWRLKKDAIKMRVDSITSEHYNKTARKEKGKSVYWVNEDVIVAEKSMESGYKLTYTKAIQLYQVFEIICNLLGTDIKSIPLYFNFVPRQEIIENGPKNSYLDVLLALHSSEGKFVFRKLTGINAPWFITTSCPKCGMGSKRVISSKLMGDNVTTKSICRKRGSSFRDEKGNIITLNGCGNSWEFKVPNTKQKLWRFIKDNDITIHFAVRWMISILKDTVDTPLGYALGDIGVIRDENNQLNINPVKVKGYGDHRLMLTSAIRMQDWLINSESEISCKLRKDALIMPRPLILFGYDQQVKFVDKDVPVEDAENLFVSDTSFLKMAKYKKIEEIVELAVRVHAFTLDELVNLKKKGKEGHGTKK